MVPIATEIRARTLEEFRSQLRHPGEEYFLVTEDHVAVHTKFYALEILELAMPSISTAPWGTRTWPRRTNQAGCLRLQRQRAGPL